MAAPNNLIFPGNQYPRVLTFLIADVRGYTRFTLENGDEAAARLAARFAELARETTSAGEGVVLELRGDEVLAVFPSVRQALRAAIQLQIRCATASAEDPSLPLPIGAGMDAGEAVPVEGGLRGAALNLAARLSSLASPGEVLVSETIARLAGKVEGLSYIDRGTTQIKGFDAPVKVVQVVTEGPVRSTSPSEHVSVEHPHDRRVPIGGFLGAMPAGPLVAREGELVRLTEALGTVETGTGRTILIAGEPGVGKTRLAQEIAQRADDRGFIVLTGRCYEHRANVPYYPFLEALTTAYMAAPASLQTDVFRRWPLLSRLLPDQLRGRLEYPSGSSDEQELLFRAVSAFIVALTSKAPVALLLDDLQWADQASLELLQHLARQTRASPVCILGMHRDLATDWERPLDAAIRNLHREELVEQVKLPRLGEVGTMALVQASLDDKVVPAISQLVHRYTAGNPFFTREVLQALIERGDLYRAEDAWDLRTTEIAIPDTVRSAIGERLARLSSTARQVLKEASVLGATFTFGDLAAMNDLMARRSEERLEGALDAAVASRLIVEAGTDGYSFSHALVQQAIHSELTSHRRRRLHRVAGDALARLSADQARRRASEIAQHLLEGGDTARALQYMLLAGEEAERVYAQGEAERWYREALDLLLTGDAIQVDGLMEADLRWRLGRVLKNVAHYDEALQTLERADAIYKEHGSDSNRLGVGSEIGNVHFATGALSEGIGRIKQLLSELNVSAESLVETARLHVPLAHLYMASGEYEASLAAAEQAASLAHEAGEDRTRAQAQAIQGEALRLLAREDEALHVLQDTVEIARSIGDVDAEFLALDAVAELLVDRGDLRESERYRRQAVDIVKRMGDPTKIAWERTSLGHVMFCMGLWTEARQQIDLALETIRALSPSRVTAYGLIRLANCDLGEGRWDDARRNLEEAITLSRRVASRATEISGHSLLAELDLLSEQPRQALARLESQLSIGDLSRKSGSSFLALAAWAHVMLGDETRARETSNQSLISARAGQNRLALLDALRVAGMVHGYAKMWRKAEQAFGEALDAASAMPHPYAEARTLSAWGLMELERGRSGETRERLSRARDIFLRLGAKRDAERCAEELQRALRTSQTR